MNETVNQSEKSEAQVSAQIGRISRKLADRAAKLPAESLDDGSFRNGNLYAEHSGGENPVYDVAYNKGLKYAAANNMFASKDYGTRIERTDNETKRSYAVTIDADRGKVEAVKKPDYPTDEEYEHLRAGGEIVQELPLDEATHQAAKALSDLRGAVAELEIEADKK